MRILRIVVSLIGLGLLLGLSGGQVTADSTQAVTLAVSNPYCVQSSTQNGVCTINVRSVSASSTDSSLTRLEISIDGKVRVRMQTFFENSAYLSEPMLGEGLKVPCGGPGSGGAAGFGQVYSVGLIGYSTSSSPISDTANVTCPFYQGFVYLPAVIR